MTINPLGEQAIWFYSILLFFYINRFKRQDFQICQYLFTRFIATKKKKKKEFNSGNDFGTAY